MPAPKLWNPMMLVADSLASLPLCLTESRIAADCTAAQPYSFSRPSPDPQDVTAAPADCLGWECSTQLLATTLLWNCTTGKQ